MILRTKRISTKANEVSLQLSYGLPDCKKMMQQYAVMLSNMSMPLEESEANLLWWLTHEGTAFRSYPSKHAESLARWCIAASLRAGFIRESVNSQTTYLFNADLLRKPGRPPKE